MSNPQSNHWRVLAICAIAFAITVACELIASHLLGLKAGVVCAWVEVFVSASALAILLRRLRAPAPPSKITYWEQRGATWCLIVFFGAIGFADAFYTYFYFVANASSQAPLTILLTTCPYGVCYLSGFLAIVLSFRRELRPFFTSPMVLVALLVSLPFFIRFLIPSLQMVYERDGWTFYLIARIINIAASFLLFFAGTMAVLRSRSLFWAFFAGGCLQIVIVNWSLSAQRVLGLPYGFDINEFLWLLGKYLTFAALWVGDETASADRLDSQSLVGQTRAAIFTGVSLLLIVLHSTSTLSLANVHSITLVFVFGTLGSIAAGQLLSERITVFARKLGETVNASHVNDLDPRDVGNLPAELSECFEHVFQTRIEREKRNIALETELGGRLRRIAHDIRSPLWILRTLVGEESEITPKKRELIQGATERIREIADGVLQPDAPIKTAPAEISELVRELLDAKRLEYNTDRVQLNLRTDVSPLYVQVEPVEFRRALSNLLNNAFESISGLGEIEVRISQAHGKVEIAIRDTGCGIRAEDMAVVFEKGVSIGKPRGSGMGLHSARKVLKEWGGAIHLASKPGVGTTAIVQLPA